MVRDTLTVARFLALYLLRKVCSRGILRRRGARLALFFIFCSALLVSAAIGFVFFRDLADDPSVVSVIVGLDNLAVPLWVGVAFCVVRILFLVSAGALDICRRFPVTPSQQSVAVFLIELCVVGLVLTVALFSSVVPLPLLYGPGALLPLVLSVVYPSLVIVLLFVLAYNALDSLFSALFMKRISGILSVTCCLLFTVFTQAALPAQLTRVTTAYQHGEHVFVPTDAVSWVAEHYGDAAAHLLALCAVAVLGFLAVVTSGGTFRGGAKFVLLRVDPRVVFSRRRRAIFASHFLAILRSQETWISLLVSVALFIYLSISGLLPPVVAVEPLAFLGLYAFSSTSSIRRLPVLRLRPGTAYAVLVASVGALVVDVLLGGAALPALFSALACLVSVPLFVTLGIVIPTQRDNPIGVLVAVAIVAAVALCSSLFRFSTLGWLLLALFLVSFAVACGVINARSLSVR